MILSDAAAYSALEEAMRGIPPSSTLFADPLHGRLVAAVADPEAGPLDLAVLVRHALLAEGKRRGAGHEARLSAPPLLASDPGVLEVAGLSRAHDGRLRAEAWRPAWLANGRDVDASPDDAAAAARRRFWPHEPGVAGDAFLERLGRDAYRSVGQRAAVRAALLTPAGASTVIELPTGEGKSLIFQAVDRVGFASDPAERHGEDGVTLVVVPTVALAYDHEAKCRRGPDEMLAYVGGASDESKSSVLERLEDRQAGLVFAAPEAACLRLRRPLLEAAKAGRLKAIVIDEAHLVDAWGTGFRTAFQSLSGLRAEVIAASPAGRAPRTLLLSATLTPETLDTIANLFSAPGEMRLLMASQVRPEPDYWVAPTADEAIRDHRIEEAIGRLPRPLILYVTEVERAKAWEARLRASGYRRIASFHGRTPDDSRRATLERWSAGALDVVVATSAFGLGIDYPHVRSVVHACVPETFDRFYQEVGRGGRDGCAMTSLIAPTFKDFATAAALNRERVIGVARARERWAAMFAHPSRRHLGGMRFRVRLDVAPGQGTDDIDMVGERSLQWNARTLTLMARSGLIRLSGEDVAQGDFQTGTFEVVEILETAHLEEASWTRLVEPVRSAIAGARARNLDLMRERLLQDRCPGDTVLELYGARVDMECGRCSLCRDEPSSKRAATLRREPPSPWEAPRLEDSLAMCMRNGVLVIAYDPGERGLAAKRSAAAAMKGLWRSGIRCVMLTGELPALFDRALKDMADRPVFMARSDLTTTSRLPAGPLAVVVGANGRFRRAASRPAHPRIVFLPTTHPDPDRPGDPLLERWDGPVMSIEALLHRIGA